VPIRRLQSKQVMSATKTVVVFVVFVAGEGISVEPKADSGMNTQSSLPVGGWLIWRTRQMWLSSGTHCSSRVSMTANASRHLLSAGKGHGGHTGAADLRRHI